MKWNVPGPGRSANIEVDEKIIRVIGFVDMFDSDTGIADGQPILTNAGAVNHELQFMIFHTNPSIGRLNAVDDDVLRVYS
jgi:hypothetical protein